MYGGTKYRSTSTYVVLLYLPNLTWLSKLYPVWIQTLCVCKNAAPCTNREHSALCILHNIDNQSVMSYNVVDKVVKTVKKLVVFLLLLVLFSAPVCLAHSGSLDSNGGHWDRSTGTYHYHSGIHAEGSSSGSSSVSYNNGTYYQTTANVNMRSSASGSSAILQTIPEGSRAIFAGSRNGNWIKLSYNGKTGWCHANYLAKVPSAVATARPTVRPTVKPVVATAPSKKSVKSSRKELLPMTFGTIFWIFAAGFGVGMIILIVYANKVADREAAMSGQAVQRESHALERGKQLAKADLQSREQELARKQKLINAQQEYIDKQKSALAESKARFESQVQEALSNFPQAESTTPVLIASDPTFRALYHKVNSSCIQTGQVVSMQTALELKLRRCPKCRPDPCVLKKPVVFVLPPDEVLRQS